MHEKGSAGQVCGAIKEDKGIQRVEAMLFALNRINDDQTLLPGINLGAHVLDTCLRDTYALEQSLTFIKSHFSSLDDVDESCARRHQKPVAGVIGAAASPVSIAVANILRLFKVSVTPSPHLCLRSLASYPGLVLFPDLSCTYIYGIGVYVQVYMYNVLF